MSIKLSLSASIYKEGGFLGRFNVFWCAELRVYVQYIDFFWSFIQQFQSSLLQNLQGWCFFRITIFSITLQFYSITFITNIH